MNHDLRNEFDPDQIISPLEKREKTPVEIQSGTDAFIRAVLPEMGANHDKKCLLPPSFEKAGHLINIQSGQTDTVSAAMNANDFFGPRETKVFNF